MWKSHRNCANYFAVPIIFFLRFCTIEGDLFFAQILVAVSNIHTTSMVSIYTDISLS